MRSGFFSAATLLAIAKLAAAQTSTSCQPLEKTCPDDPALGTTRTIDFTQGASKDFTALPGTTVNYGPDGVEFTITNEKQAPTMDSNWYFFFGRAEVVMKASTGQGIVSSFVLESDDLDEVDWEWLGGDFAQVQSNYFGKGDDSTFDRGAYHPVSNPQDGFHTYALDWSADSIVWSVDNVPVRTLLYNDAKGGTRFPQTPMKVKIGSWDAGSSTSPPGTVQWAGGLTDFTGNPSYTMTVKSITVTDKQTGAGSYSYGDMSGTWQSIKISEGNGSSTGADESNSSSSAEGSSSTSSTAAPSSTKASSTKASSSSTKSSSSSSHTSTMSTVTKSSTQAPSSTAAPSTTANNSTSSPTSTGPATESSTGAATSYGANLAMVGAVVAFFAL